MGYLIPEESRKTFSRHFRYVLEQTDLCKYGWKNNSVINRDEENIYHYFYEAGEWKKWENLKAPGDDGAILFRDYKIAHRILMSYIDKGEPVFLVGPPSTSKNYVFKNLISNFPQEKYKINKLACSKLTDKSFVYSKIVSMISTERYSKKVRGLSNCKQNIFYVHDVALPMHRGRQEQNSLVEFMRELYSLGGWYIEKSFK